MPFFTLGAEDAKRPKGGVPVAIVESTNPSMSGQLLFLHEEDAGKKEPMSSATAWLALPTAGVGAQTGHMEGLEVEDTLDMRKIGSGLEALKPKDRDAMWKQLGKLAKDGAPASSVPAGPYRDAFAALKKPQTVALAANRVVLPPGCSFSLLPDPREGKRNVVFAAAGAGAGKSYWAAEFVRLWMQLNEGRTVYYVSEVEIPKVDPAFAGLPLKRIPIDDLPADVTVLGHSLVIADDYDSLTGGRFKAVDEFLRSIVFLNRKFGTTLLVTSHTLCGGKKTDAMWNSADYVVLFPRSAIKSQLDYALGKKLGLDNDSILNIRLLGRAVCVRRVVPYCAVGSDAACVLT